MSAFQKGAAPPGPPPNWEPVDLGQSQRDEPSQSISAITQTPSSLSSPPTADQRVYPMILHPSYDRDVLSLIYVPPAMAQQYLDHFRTRNLSYLPFVYIPPTMTSDQLRQKYPFFWVCIMEVVTCRNPEKGDSFGRITNHIHQRVMIDIAPSMDLLLGIMTFVSW
jgi:hypothetical protein